MTGTTDPSDQGPTPAIDTSVPHTARVWNYLLGGKDNYPADRESAELSLSMIPDAAGAARADRRLLMRVVQHLVGEVGIRQFLDIGTGLPTANNTHEIAQATAPECRVVYVDNDPLVLAHARALLTSTSEGVTDYLDADLRDPEKIVQEAARTLDFTQPLALMLLGIVNHIVDDDEAYAIIHRLVDAVPSGSYLAMSHSTADFHGETMEKVMRLWNEGGGTPPIVARSHQEVTRFFDRLELLEPGVVSSSLWRPDLCELGTPTEVFQICGVGRKP
ncbi:MAG: SAM-dependent methyltransferase [Pseudonocardiaceae bacterium]